MVTINEIFPNPAGLDTKSEFIEIYNNGQTTVDLSGWYLKNGANKKFIFTDEEIQTGEYLVLDYSQTKLTVRNSDEKLFFYDSDGKLADKAAFLGQAPEGKSFSRTGGGNFIWTNPTRGALNDSHSEFPILNNAYPIGEPLNFSGGNFNFWGLLFGVALIVSLTTVFIVKYNENLSKLFFGKN